MTIEFFLTHQVGNIAMKCFHKFSGNKKKKKAKKEDWIGIWSSNLYTVNLAMSLPRLALDDFELLFNTNCW